MYPAHKQLTVDQNKCQVGDIVQFVLSFPIFISFLSNFKSCFHFRFSLIVSFLKNNGSFSNNLKTKQIRSAWAPRPSWLFFLRFWSEKSFLVFNGVIRDSSLKGALLEDKLSKCNKQALNQLLVVENI